MSDGAHPPAWRGRRRALLGGALSAAALALGGCAPARDAAGGGATAGDGRVPPLDPLFDDLEQRTFRYFWETSDPATGLAPDRWPTRTFASVAATGFALTACGIGAERGYVTRAQARERALATLRFLHGAPQGPQPSGAAGHRGFYYHFLDFDTGTRHGDSELSTVDTALLLAGVLYAAEWFDAADAGESEIRRLAAELYARVDWPWACVRGAAVAHGWKPEVGFLTHDWQGYNEAMLVYLLALGSPRHALGASAWDAWTATYAHSWGRLYGQEHLTFGPMFGHQYSAVWVDYRGIRDAFMRARGLDYFENSRRAVLAQRAYAIRNPLGWRDYSADVWGLTACDGPVDALLEYRGEQRMFRTYAARGVNLDPDHDYDDGTIAPTAALASLPFAPQLVTAAARALHARYGEVIYGRYGFLDAFNRSFDHDLALYHGRRVPGFGWVDTDYIGIDQGPILAMIANHRSDAVWRTMRRSPHLRRGLERAGFSGGWLR